MQNLDLGAANWRRSSFSDSNVGDCVEVAAGFPGLVPVRDSKDPEGPVLLFPAAAWAAFVTGIKVGEFRPGG
ncbi:DUF397 domain-containing protein [Kitasatospora sp. NPDC002227]|uniref:DUF397 domain-containing protein n=1 Tax=Kitasatospora sp. NPDC002227 TaxID=3154773 RepID=UPI003327274F